MDDKDSLVAKILKSFSKQEGLDDLLKMSEHWNGYKRENAVRRLGLFGNPVAIPMLIVRLNDWVPHVRNAAIGALQELMVSNNAKAFSISLPRLYHLETCQRDKHSEFIATVIEFLLRAENVESIKAAAFSCDPMLARIAVRLCFDYSLMPKKELVERCLAHSDVVVRDIAAKLLRDFSGDALEKLLEVAIQDPFMPIRREAFQLYLRKIPEKGLGIAHSFLFDRHISIREIAIVHLSRHEVDVREMYAHIVQSDSQGIARTRYAILGIACIGAKNEIPSIKIHLTNEAPSIRKACLQALEKLIGDKVCPLLLGGLDDMSPSVAKEAARIINKLGIKLSASELVNAIDLQSHTHTLAVALLASKKANKWERLLFLLRAMNKIDRTNESDTETIKLELERWNIDFNRSSSQPSKTQIQNISVEYESCAYFLSEASRRSMEFTLGVLCH